jgi:hypothetical protein
MDIETLFATLESDRLTASGKACITIAKRLFGTGVGEVASREARCWVKLALEADKDDLARRVKDLEEKFGGKTQAREVAERMAARKRAGGDNVVAFPTKDGI